MYKYLFLLVITVLVSTCSKFDSEIQNKKKIITASKKCSNVDFDDSPFEKMDHVNLFKCFKWDEKLPILFSMISNYDEVQWNDTVSFVHNSLYKNPESKAKLISELKEMVDDGSINAFSKFFSKIFDEDLILLINEIHQEKNINSLRKMSDIFKNDGKRYLSFLNGVKIISKNLKIPEGKDIELRKIFVDFMDEVSKEVKTKKYDIEYVNVSNLFQSGKSLPLYDFMQFSKSPEDLSYMISYSDKYPEIYSDTALINKMYLEGVYCETPHNNYVFNIKYELGRKIKALYTRSYQEMLNELFDGFSKRIIFKEICHEQFDKKNLAMWDAFERAMDHLLGFDNQAHFQFIKNIHMLFDADKYTNSVLKFLSSEVAKKLNKYLSKLSVTESVHLYEFIKKLTPEEHQEIAKSLETVFSSEYKDEVYELLNIWDSLSEKAKLKITDVFLVKNKVDNFWLLEEHVVNILNGNPEIFNQFYKGILSNDLLTKNHKFISSFLSTGEDYIKFISEEYMQSYISSFVTMINSRHKNEKYVPENLGVYVVSKKDMNEELLNLKSCFKNLLPEAKSLNLSLFTMNMDSTCLKLRNPSEIVPFVTIWLSQIDKEFFDYSGSNLIEEKSWLDRDFTSTIMATLYLAGNKHKEIFNTLPTVLIDRISKSYSPKLENEIESVFEIVNSAFISQEEFSIDLLKKFTASDRNDLNRKVLNMAERYIKADSYTWKNVSLDCKKQNYNIGIDPCYSNIRITNTVLEVIEILFKDYGNGKLMHSLLSLFTPGEGVSIPFSKRKSVKKVVSIKEILGMLIDFYYKKSNMEYFHGKRDSITTTVNTLEKIETTIREISFSNNFYGSYFVNEVSAADDYLKKVNKLKKLVGLMNSAKGAMNIIGLVPKEAKIMIKNVNESYDGLIEGGEDFNNSVLGKPMNYSLTLQGLLAALTETSKSKYQSFFPFKKPDLEAGANHNSQFLVKVSEAGLGSLLQRFLIDVTDKNPKEFLASTNLNIINENLLTSFSPQAAHDMIDEVEKIIFKNGKIKDTFRKSLLKFMDDSINLKSLKPLAWNILILTSELGFSKGDIDNVFTLIPHLLNNLENYSNLSENKNLNNVIDSVAGAVDFLLQEIRVDADFKENVKKDIKYLLSNSDKISLVLNDLITSKNIDQLNDFIDFMSRLIKELDKKDKVFLVETLRDLFEKDILVDLQAKLQEELGVGGNKLISFFKFIKYKSNSGNSILSDVLKQVLVDKKDHTKELLYMIDQTVNLAP